LLICIIEIIFVPLYQPQQETKKGGKVPIPKWYLGDCATGSDESRIIYDSEVFQRTFNQPWHRPQFVQKSPDGSLEQVTKETVE
jgi:hypothetical protein